MAKGVTIFIEIVKKLANNNFIAVGRCESVKIRNEINKFQNISYFEWVSDMKKIYSQTKILIHPAIWPEPFGRCIIEAMSNGIPCIVSNRGGIPEAVNDAGIIMDEPFDIEEWINNIGMLQNEEIYKLFSTKSKQYSKNFNYKNQIRLFNKILEYENIIKP
jgi:glycosyltransferase involved in cell wall biosynthesis